MLNELGRVWWCGEGRWCVMWHCRLRGWIVRRDSGYGLCRCVGVTDGRCGRLIGGLCISWADGIGAGVLNPVDGLVCIGMIVGSAHRTVDIPSLRMRAS